MESLSLDESSKIGEGRDEEMGASCWVESLLFTGCLDFVCFADFRAEAALAEDVFLVADFLDGLAANVPE